jgi:hypothetical protein
LARPSSTETEGRLFSIAASAELTKRLLQELDPGPLAPEARVIPLDQAASCRTMRCACIKYKPNSRNAANLRCSASAIYALQLTRARCPMEPRDEFFLSDCPTRMRWPCIRGSSERKELACTSFQTVLNRNLRLLPISFDLKNAYQANDNYVSHRASQFRVLEDSARLLGQAMRA